MKFKIFIIISFFYSYQIFAQIKTDAVSIFKMHLFLNNKNVDDIMITKNDSLYKAFSDIVSLEIDTLKISGNYELTISSLSPKFKFFQLKKHIYNRELNDKELQLFRIFGDNTCSIAINQETGKSYKLLGFDTNDFLTFLSDYKIEYKEKLGKKLRTNFFLKNFKVSGIDFECLYKGLKNSKNDIIKYPCLVRVNDPVWIE